MLPVVTQPDTQTSFIHTYTNIGSDSIQQTPSPCTHLLLGECSLNDIKYHMGGRGVSLWREKEAYKTKLDYLFL